MCWRIQVTGKVQRKLRTKDLHNKKLRWERGGEYQGLGSGEALEQLWDARCGGRKLLRSVASCGL